ncbi:MAG: leucine-rich repeat protein, partial [Acholeplasmataceae bacterium]
NEVVLYDQDGSVYRTYDDVFRGDTIELPFYAHEDLVFVGWSDGESIHYPAYVVGSKRELTAVMEDPLDVFGYETFAGGRLASIDGYSGDALHLRIPDAIDGAEVNTLSLRAFEGLPLVSVEIPDTIRLINALAFKDMPSLKAVTFYDGPLRYAYDDPMYDDFDEIISAGNCTIESTESSTAWTYEKGCPIHAVTGIELLWEIDDIPYYRYDVLYDLEFYPDYDPELIIIDEAFAQLESLERVVFPETYDRLRALIFVDTPNLVDVSFTGDDPNYEVSDGVVYFRGKEDLIYYPRAREQESFTVPETVKKIWSYAFSDQRRLVSIDIGSSVESIDPTAFMGMTSLESIEVDGANGSFWSSDGVLFERYSESVLLVKYPAARTDTSYVVPEEVTQLSPQSFADNQFLENLELPEGLLIISREAFAYSRSLLSIEIPRSVELIDYLAFHDTGFESVIIRRSVAEDGSITRGQLGTDRGGLPVFYVPDDSFDDYVKTSFWEDFEAYIRPYSDYEPD